MASPIHSYLTPINLAFLAIVLFLVQRIHFELTTGARRRRIIAENGCEPAYKYPHKGIMGKLMGLDVIQDMMKSGKEGRMHESGRLRNFANGRNTILSRRLLSDSVITIEPENIKAVSPPRNWALEIFAHLDLGGLVATRIAAQQL